MPTRASTIDISSPSIASAPTPWWLWPNVLSLDAPIVASLWQNLAAKDTGVSLSLAGKIALPLAVWVIYLADRLLDSIRLEEASPSARHCFYRSHRLAGLLLLISVSSALAVALRFLPPEVLRNGLWVSTLVGAYMVAVHALPGLRAGLPKELAVALIFSAGSTLTVWTRMADPWSMVTPALLFAFLCWLNCCAIEVWEFGRNRCDQAPSKSASWMVRRLANLSVAIGCVTVVAFPFSQFHLFFLSISICSFAYCWLERVQRSLDGDAVRVLADVPLLVPILLLGLR